MSLKKLMPQGLRRLASAVAAATLAAGLAACGGGDRAERYVPERIFAFGDELSVLVPDPSNPTSTTLARKYGVNAVDSNGNRDCTLYPLWTQSLAASFGMAFSECQGSATNTNAYMRAVVGAKTSGTLGNASGMGLKEQVDTYLATGSPREKDLVTILAGANDVLDAYAAYAASARDDAAYSGALATVTRAAETLAAQVNRLAQAGPAVLVSTIPNMGQSPFAAAQDAAFPGEVRRRSQVLSDLSLRFNDALQSGGVIARGLASYNLTGHDYGLIQTGTSWINAVATSSNGDVRAYNATPMCGTALPDCSASTLTTGADVNTWVWADATHPGPVYQSQLGARAVRLTGSTGLPF